MLPEHLRRSMNAIDLTEAAELDRTQLQKDKEASDIDSTWEDERQQHERIAIENLPFIHIDSSPSCSEQAAPSYRHSEDPEHLRATDEENRAFCDAEPEQEASPHPEAEGAHNEPSCSSHQVHIRRPDDNGVAATPVVSARDVHHVGFYGDFEQVIL